MSVTEEQLRQKIVGQEYESWIMYGHEPDEIFQRYQHKIEEDFGTIPIKNMINIFEKYLEEIMVKDLPERLRRRYEEEGYIVRHSQPEVKEVLKSWVEQQDKEPDSPTKFRSEVKDACFDRYFLTQWVDVNPISIQAVKEYRSQKREKTLYQRRLLELGKKRWRDADRIESWKKLFCGRNATAEEMDRRLIILGRTGGPCHKCGSIWHTRGDHYQSFYCNCLGSGYRFLSCDHEKAKDTEDARNNKEEKFTCRGVLNYAALNK